MKTSYTSKIHTEFTADVNWVKNISEFSMTSSEVHLWNISVPEHFPMLFKRSRAILSEHDYCRAKRFYRADDYRSFLTGRIILRLLISNYLSKPASMLEFTTEGGKPCISQSPLKYNLSYAEENVLISIGSCNTGVDIEHVRSSFNFEDVLSTCFSQCEKAVIENEAESSKEFFLQWTRKEAILKFTGQGIIDDLTEVPSLSGMHLLKNTGVKLDTNISLLSFNLSPDCVASIAYPASVAKVKYFEW